MNECDYCSKHFDTYNCDKCPYYRDHLINDKCPAYDPEWDLLEEVYKSEVYAKKQDESAY